MLTNDDDDHDGHDHDDGDHDEGNETHHDDDDHDDGDHDEDGHDNNETSMEDLMEQMMQQMMQQMFNEMDVNNDSILDAEELKALNSMGEDHEDPVCHDPATHLDTDQTDRASCEAAGNIWIIGEPNDGTRGYLTIHVENEGDYGFAMPSDISVFLLMSEGHDDHDDHDDHGEGGHDEHEDDGDGNHDDHEGEEDSTLVADEEEDAFEYDPHSWLDPIAFKAQTQLVLSALIEVFPDGADTFTANAEAFMAELDKVHLGYMAAFGPDGTCANKTAAANHNAYSYITERYGVQFITVHGLDPEGQPSVQDIEKVISKINEDEINVLFIEEYTQSSSVDVIVESTDVEVMYLYTMEKSPSDVNDDYLSMLNKNLDNLKTGLECAI
jgi:zinc transport system substrate-binding protein